MSDTPRTDVAEHNMGSIVEPHYVVDIAFARQLERELAEAKEQLRLCNVDQWTTAAELAEAKKDAERYRWLRDNTCKSSLYEHCGIEGYDTEVMISGEVLDAAIDAAMKEGK
jgi:hypothetical protein